MDPSGAISPLVAATFGHGRDGRFGPTPFRAGWFSIVASAKSSTPAAGAAPFNPFSTGTARSAAAISLTLSSPRPAALAPAFASPRSKAPFSPGRTLLEQTTDVAGLGSYRALTDHLKRPSPTH
jgi:hypothetical protein